MVALATVTFESGVIVGTDGFGLTSGTAPTLESANPIAGVYSATFTVSGGGFGRREWANPGNATLYHAFYVRVAAYPTQKMCLFDVRSGLSRRYSVILHPDGTLELQKTTAATGIISTALALDTTYRVEITNDDAVGLQLALAVGSGAATVVGATTKNTSTSTSLADIGVKDEFGLNPAATLTIDELRIDTAAMPVLAPLPVSGETAATRGQLGIQSRVEPITSHKTAKRASLGIQARLQPVVIEPVVVAARGQLGIQVRLQPIAEAALTAAVRSQLGMQVRLQPYVTHRAAMRVQIGLAASAQTHDEQRARLRVQLGIAAHDAYTGPGTGVVAAGQRFNVNDIREGDSFNVWLPWGGIEGVGTLAHVKSRSIRDDQSEQDLTLQVVPQPDPRLVPGQAGGGRPGLKPQRSDVARRIARTERDQDRLERNRS